MSTAQRSDEEEELLDDAGLTLVELIVTLFVTALLLPIVFTLITGFVNQGTGEANTLTSLQQDQRAGNEFIEYLHGASLVLAGSNSTTLVVDIDAGTSSAGVPESAVLTATYTAGSTARSGLFTTSLLPSVTPSVAAISSSSIDATTTTSSTPIFEYELSTGGEPVANPSLSQLSQIIAVDVSVSFLGENAAAVQQTEGSTLSTTVYLDNSVGAAGFGDTTGVVASAPFSSPAGTVTATATVTGTGSPATDPTSGTVSFVFTPTSGSAISPPACQNLALTSSANSVTCNVVLSPLTTYGVVATFSGTPGDSGFSASASPSVSVITT